MEQRGSHRGERSRLLPFPAPSPSALVGIAVLVLIGIGVIHLSTSGSAVPLERGTVPEAPLDEVPSSAASGENLPGEALDPVAAGDGPVTEEGTGAEDEGSAPDDQHDGAEELVVHVSGAVDRPGLVHVPRGARVDDAVQAAGGTSDDADLALVNLARPVVDGEQIHIPRPGETPPPIAAPSGSGDPAPADSSAGEKSATIDLNAADATALQELPGVGPAIAERILDHRERNGPFSSVEDLLEVPGIGPATLEKIRDRATVS